MFRYAKWKVSIREIKCICKQNPIYPYAKSNLSISKIEFIHNINAKSNVSIIKIEYLKYNYDVIHLKNSVIQ